MEVLSDPFGRKDLWGIISAGWGDLSSGVPCPTLHTSKPEAALKLSLGPLTMQIPLDHEHVLLSYVNAVTYSGSKHFVGHEGCAWHCAGQRSCGSDNNS